MTEVSGTVIGHYRIDNLVGAGGMGTVYKAYDLNLNRPVALKLMHPEIASQPKFRERLKAEAQTAANLDHPSIVKIYNFGETPDGLLYIAMEFIKDGSLRSHLRRVMNKRGQLDLPLVLQIAIQIAEALDFAHRAGVIHRDVKPGNLILKRLPRPEESGLAAFRAILTDFGLVQVANSGFTTESGMAMGTPIYMSPEQCEGEPLDGRSDLYSLGVVLYEMLAGRPPFEFKSLSQAVATHVKEIYPPTVRELRTDVPPLIDALLSRAFAKDREDRFATGKEMSDALRTAFFSISDTPTSWWTTKRTPEQPEIELVPPLSGDELIVRTMGRGAIDRYPLTKMEYAIGRSGDNDLVLASGAVSRHHARIEHTAHGWMIRPLVGINGTFLKGERLMPDKQQRIRLGEPMLIGPYEMWLSGGGSPILEPTMIAEPTQMYESVPLDATIIEAPPDAPTQTLHRSQPTTQEAKFGLFIAPRSADVEPGRSAEFVLEVLNRSAVDDRVRFEVSGIPSSWVDLPQGFTPVPAGERAELRFRITPPRTPETSYGRQRFHIELESQRNPNERPDVQAELTLGTFESFELMMTPRELRLPETVTVSITNTGNQPAEYAVVARESEGRVKFAGERGRVRVQPGQTTDVELALEARRAGIFSAQTDIPYEVEVRSATGAVQVQHGTAMDGSRVLPILQFIGLILLVTMCMLTALFGVTDLFNSRTTGNMNNGTNVQIPISGGQLNALASPTPLPTSILPTFTSEPVNNTANPAVNPSDLDGDGLSNEQEAQVGSDPNLADTDGDGLSDRVEVFDVGTEPTVRDSDNDGLSDGDEYLIHGTSPRLRDSDNDGIDDGTELEQGSNPLVAEAASATQVAQTRSPTSLPTIQLTSTPTIVPPATSTAVAIAPSATPLPPTSVSTAVLPTDTPPAPTEEPTAVLTVAPIATDTATPEPPTETPIPPTDVPTATPTLVATATPTATVTLTLTPTVAATSTVVPTLEPPTPLLTCTDELMVVDGNLLEATWQAALLSTFPEQAASPSVNLFMMRDSNKLYFAAVIADDTAADGDFFHLFFDVNNNRGNPDEADRFLKLGFEDDSSKLWVGIGSNTDDAAWAVETIPSESWQVVVVKGPSGWLVEGEIDLTIEMTDLGDSFGLMAQLASNGGTFTDWPISAEPTNASTWQPINSPATCP